jgi:hypothetical protein
MTGAAGAFIILLKEGASDPILAFGHGDSTQWHVLSYPYLEEGDLDPENVLAS